VNPIDHYEAFLGHPTFGLRGFVDVEGRPVIAEALISEGERRLLEMRACPYPGSRKGHALPMNVSALKQIARHWKDIRGAAMFVRRHYLIGSRTSASHIVDVMRVAYAAAWLPLYLVQRAARPLHSGTIPVFLGGLHKSTIDVASMMQLMVFEALCDDDRGHLGRVVTVEEISSYAEARGFFIGAQGVCAGPPGMVNELIATLVGEGHSAVPLDEPLRELIGEIDRCFEFLDQLIGITLAKHVFRIHARVLVEEIAVKAGQSVSALLSGLGCLHCPVHAPPDIASMSRIEEEKRALIDRVPSHRLAVAVEGLSDMTARMVGHRPEGPTCSALSGRSIQWEEAVQVFFTRAEIAVWRALGREGQPRAINESDLVQVFGVTPRHVLARFAAQSLPRP